MIAGLEKIFGTFRPNDDGWWVPVCGRCSRIVSQRMYSEEVGIYIINTPDAVFIIDGPQGQSELIAALALLRKRIIVVLTHGPAFNKSSRLVDALGATVLLHERDQENPWLGRNAKHCTFWSGESLELAVDLVAYHTGGHSPGHVMIHDATEGGILFSGDEVYADTRGNVTVDSSVSRLTIRQTYLQRLADIVTPLSIETVLPLHESSFQRGRDRILDLAKSQGL